MDLSDVAEVVIMAFLGTVLTVACMAVFVGLVVLTYAHPLIGGGVLTIFSVWFYIIKKELSS